ncbi:MAG: hypothetical protein LBT68_01125, partial [Spirochaetales bacterium]|nr:hypothetical protein [Spirochaetales bacterium]
MKFFLLLLGLCVLPLCVLCARDIVVTVEDADLNIPLEGAAVYSWDGTQHICDETGSVSLRVPDDRQVVVRIAYPGYESGRLVLDLTQARFTSSLRLGGVMESRELLVEAGRAGTSEAKSGRGVAISGENLTRT